MESERDYYKRELRVLKAITTPRRMTPAAAAEARRPGQVGTSTAMTALHKWPRKFAAHTSDYTADDSDAL